MMLYICARNNQCAKPCGNECYYTTDFLKSKLYHDEVKPKEITFVKDLRGDFWEINPSLIAIPLTLLIHKSYDQLAKEKGW